MHLSKYLIATVLVGATSLGQPQRAQADGSAVAAGIIGGIIGGAIVNDQRRKTTTVRRTYRPGIPSTSEGREIQTSLNYFGFNAGRVDGQIGQGTRNAAARYQAFMGYPATGNMTLYEQDFLINSYHRAISGGPTTSQMIATNPQGVRGLLLTFRDQANGTNTYAAAPMPAPMAPGTVGTMAMVTVQPPAAMAPAAAAPVAAPVEVAAPAAPAAPGLPTFMASGGKSDASLTSHCNKVSLLTNSNGGFTRAETMTDANFVLSEQFCLARTYAITRGEEMAAKLQGVTQQDIVAQCDGIGTAMKTHVAALSLEPLGTVMRDVNSFVLSTGMAPAQLSDTSRICLSSGYRTDNMDVAIGSALLLYALGDQVYGELLGHHLSQGFGASKRGDLAGEWYMASFDALDNGAEPVFAPGQSDRAQLLRVAAFGAPEPELPQVQPASAGAALPTFELKK